MTNLPRLMPDIVDLTVENRWERRATLLRLVAIRTREGGDSWTSLGIGDLMRYGRTYGQARWDHELLKRMATKDRILRRLSSRGAGRRADLYRIRGESLEVLGEWRHVPWRGSAKSAMALLRALEPDAVPSGMGAVFPGQSDALGAVTPPPEGSFDVPLSVKEPRPSPDEPRPSPKSPGLLPPGTAPMGRGIAPATPSSFKYLKPSLPTLPSEAEEGGREEELRQDCNRLRTALSDVLERGITGRRFPDRLDVIARAHIEAGDFEALLGSVQRFRGTHSIADAVEALEAWATPATRPRRTLEQALQRRATVVGLLPLHELDDPEHDRLSIELTALDEEVASLRESRGSDTPAG
jgi:hypothetical protein